MLVCGCLCLSDDDDVLAPSIDNQQLIINNCYQKHQQACAEDFFY